MGAGIGAGITGTNREGGMMIRGLTESLKNISTSVIKQKKEYAPDFVRMEKSADTPSFTMYIDYGSGNGTSISDEDREANKKWFDSRVSAWNGALNTHELNAQARHKTVLEESKAKGMSMEQAEKAANAARDAYTIDALAKHFSSGRGKNPARGKAKIKSRNKTYRYKG